MHHVRSVTSLGGLLAVVAIGCGGAPPREAPRVNGSDVPPLPDAAPTYPPSIAISPRHVCATRGGEVWCWGDGAKQRLGSSISGIAGPVKVPGVTAARAVVATSDLSCALVDGGHVTCWGDGPFTSADQTLGGPRTIPDLEGVFAMSATDGYLCVIHAEGEAPRSGRVTCLGRSSLGALGDTQRGPHRFDVPGIEDATTIATSNAATCATRATGGLWCWGNASAVDGAAKPGPTPPHAIAERSGAVSVTATLQGFCATNGAGTTICQKASRAAAPKAGVKAFALGTRHGCAIDDEGLSCWGDVQSAALGRVVDVTSNDTAAVTRVPDTSDVVALAAGDDLTCVARATGAVQCFGRSRSGRLGNGASDVVGRATVIEDMGVVRSAALGTGFGCGLAGDTVKCWGTSYMPEDPRARASASPPLRLFPQVRAVDATIDRVVVNLSDVAWLQRTDGSVQLFRGGVDTGAPPAAPVTVPALSGVKALTGSGGRSFALLDSGKIVSFRAPTSATPIEDIRPTPVNGLGGYTTLATSTFAPTLGCGVKRTREAECFRTTRALLTEPTNAAAVKALPVADVVRLSTSSTMACAERAKGSARCFELTPEGLLTEVALDVPDGLHALTPVLGRELCGIDGEGHAGCSFDLNGALVRSTKRERWFELAGVEGAKEIVLAHPSLCAIDGGGAMACVGSNENDRIAATGTPPWSMRPTTVTLE